MEGSKWQVSGETVVDWPAKSVYISLARVLLKKGENSMNNRPIVVMAVFAAFLFFILTMITPVSAQSSTPTPINPKSSPTPDLDPTRIAELEKKVFQLETIQTQQMASLKDSNEQYRSLLTLMSAFIGILALAGGIFQVFVTVFQFRRDNKQEAIQAEREKREKEREQAQQALQAGREQERDQVQHKGIQQVSEIMKVVKDTFESRLDAEKEARLEAKSAHEELEKVLAEVRFLDQFFKNFQANIKSARQSIEDTASQLALTPRHDLRPVANELDNFAKQFDSFKTNYERLEQEPHPSFSTKALYIRGIAAHYLNEPQIAKPYLSQVTRLQQPEKGDIDETAYKRRIANANYYLGIIDLNFGNAQVAIKSFEQANSLDSDRTDFLTKVVEAEAYVMGGKEEDFDNAEKVISEINEGLLRKRSKAGHLTGVYLRLQSRAFLVRANMMILKREEDWYKGVEKLLEPIHSDDPSYYYATVTLAQAYAIHDKHDAAHDKHGAAKGLFQEAYEIIERSGHFFTVTETRSQILLQMVAGLCCQHGIMAKTRADEHLNKAGNLLAMLPKIDSQACTVFSTLSKHNENSNTIQDHIELIRKGKVLLEISG